MLIVQFQKISLLPLQKVFVLFVFAPPPPPGNSSLASYFAPKILTFKTPLPLGISLTFHGVGMDFFLELCIAIYVIFLGESILCLFGSKGCMPAWIWPILKETSPQSTVTWSVMEQQNREAKTVYYRLLCGGLNGHVILSFVHACINLVKQYFFYNMSFWACVDEKLSKQRKIYIQ